MRKNGRTAHKLEKLAWCFSRPHWAGNHGVLLPVKHKLVSAGIARKIYFGDYEAKEIKIISKRLAADDAAFHVAPSLGFLSAYCAKHKGAANVFSYEISPNMVPLIRKNVFFFHRPTGSPQGQGRRRRHTEPRRGEPTPSLPPKRGLEGRVVH